MKLGIIGLGRMGQAVAYRLLRAKHDVVGFDIGVDNARDAKNLGVHVVETVQELAQHVNLIWLMVPAGQTVDTIVQELLPYMRPGYVIIDAGNSFYKDSMRRAQMLIKDDIHYIDCGLSGGLQGRELGFCIMVGGDKKIYEALNPIFSALAFPEGFGYVGSSGAGHYVKMVHNGIEYALLEAYAEGFSLLKNGSFEHMDLAQIATLWNRGSVIRSWLLQLTAEILQYDQKFMEISGRLDQTGMGLWTVEEAYTKKIPVPCIEKAVQVRIQSQQTKGSFATKLIALLRNAFGGHRVYTKRDDL